jgi:vacuolar-type H+-ATPase catalytic subunit A/Vma1
MTVDQQKDKAYHAVSSATAGAVGNGNDDGARTFVENLVDLDGDFTEYAEPLDRLAFMIDVACGIVVGLLHLRSFALPFPVDKVLSERQYSNLRELEAAQQKLWAQEAEAAQQELWAQEAEAAQQKLWAQEAEAAQQELWAQEAEAAQQELWAQEAYNSMDTSKSMTDSLIDVAIGRLRRSHESKNDLYVEAAFKARGNRGPIGHG